MKATPLTEANTETGESTSTLSSRPLTLSTSKHSFRSLLNPSHIFPLSPMMLGYIAMSIVLCTWSGFHLSLRAIGGSELTTMDMAFIRFAVPTMLLLPFMPSRIHKLKSMNLSDIPLLLLGGIPFFIIAALGAKTVPAAYVGNILAGTPSLFVAALLYLAYRQKVEKRKIMPLALILIGVLVMTFAQATPITSEVLTGIMYLVAGSIVWAAYTIGLKQTKLDPISIAFIVTSSSLVIMSICIPFGLFESNLLNSSFESIWPFLLVQGLGVGVISTVGYTYAVNKLDSSRATVLGSLSPVLTAVLAIPFFNEQLSIATVIGLFLTALGVILASVIRPKIMAARKEHRTPYLGRS